MTPSLYAWNCSDTVCLMPMLMPMKDPEILQKHATMPRMLSLTLLAPSSDSCILYRIAGPMLLLVTQADAANPDPLRNHLCVEGASAAVKGLAGGD